MLFHHNYSKKHCYVSENIFLNLASECLFNFGLFYPQIFRDVNHVNFISSVISERARSLSFAMDWYVLKLDLGRLGRSNQVKSKKDLDRPLL